MDAADVAAEAVFGVCCCAAVVFAADGARTFAIGASTREISEGGRASAGRFPGGELPVAGFRLPEG